MIFKKIFSFCFHWKGKKSRNSFEREISVEWGCITLTFLTRDCICFSGTLSEEDWKPPLPAYDFLQMMETAAPELPLHTPQRQGDTPTARRPPESPGGDTTTQEEPSQELAVISSTASLSRKGQSRMPENMQTGAQRRSSSFRPKGLQYGQDRCCRTCPSAKQAEPNPTPA